MAADTKYLSYLKFILQFPKSFFENGMFLDSFVILHVSRRIKTQFRLHNCLDNHFAASNNHLMWQLTQH